MTRALAAAVVITIVAGCASGDSQSPDAPLTIFAAASLRDVLPEIDPLPDYVFAGSNQLAAQLRDGARADVFVSANERLATELAEAGVVGRPRMVASNLLVVVVPRSSSRVRTLDDLREPGIKLVLGANGVPAGDYARAALPVAGLESALDNVVSLEDDVSGVVAKVALGEADAGVVYATDARLAHDRVRAVPLPASAQPRIAYVAAAVTHRSKVARARTYLDLLVGERGRRAFEAAGFLPPPP